MNNSVYQAIFADKSEFIMSSKEQAIIYTTKDRKRYLFNMKSENLNRNRGIMIRLEYFKAILRGWIFSEELEFKSKRQVKKDFQRAISKMTIKGLGLKGIEY